MSKDNLRSLREKLGVSRKGNTLVGHATPTTPEPPEDDPDEPGFDGESTLQLTASDIEVLDEPGGQIIEADLEHDEPVIVDQTGPPAPPRPPKRPPKQTSKRPPKQTPKQAPKQAPKQTPKQAPKQTPKQAPKQAPKRTPKRTPTPPTPPLRETAKEPGPPVATEVSVDTGDHEPVEAAPPPTVIAAVEDESRLYRREAEAVATTMPERAGLMQIEAARVLEDAGSSPEDVVGHLDEALELAPTSSQVIALVRNAMARLGLFERVLELTERLTEIGGDNRIRVAALLEGAAIRKHNRHDSRGAAELTEQALELQPGVIPALALRALLCLELQQDSKAAEALEQLAEALTEPRERSLALLAAGTLLEHKLEETDRAQQDYQRAAEGDPDNPFATLALHDLHLLGGNWRELAQDLERLAEISSDPQTRSGYLLQAGSLYLDRAADLEAATRTLVAAAEAAPDEMAPLSRVAHVYEETGRYQELVDALRRLLALTLDPRAKPPALCRIGWLLHQRLGQSDQAIEAYRDALALQPGYLPALLALATIHRQRGDYEGLVSILAPETEGTEAAERRAMLCLEVGGIYVNHLQQPDEAVRYYQRGLELYPALWVAFWHLHRLLIQLQRFDVLAELVKQRCQVARDPKTRAFLLLQLARLQAGPLNEIDQAITTLGEARVAGACRVAAIELAELYERSGQYSELVSLLLSEAEDTTDGDEARGRRLQAAALLDENLGEHDRALEIYREVLEQDPRDAVALHCAGRMYHRLGRWKDLLGLYRHELEVQPDREDATELLYRSGRLYEEQLGQPDDAIAAYMEALERDPHAAVALDAVVRLVRSENRRRELVEMLERHAGVISEAPAAADALCRAAELAYGHLGESGRAARLYRAALERCPGFRSATRGLLDMRLRQKKLEEASTLLEELISGATSDAERGQLAFRLARLREYRIDEKPTVERYDEAAASSPRGERLRLEQLRARWLAGGELGEALQAAARSTEDDGLAGSFWLFAAQLYELTGNDEMQLVAAEQAFRLAGDCLASATCLQRGLRRAGETAVLAALLEQQSDGEPDAVMRLAQLSAAARGQLMAGNPDDARRIALRCLELDAEHLASLSLLGRLAAAADRWEELAGMQDRLTTACKDRENRLQAALQASDLWAHRVGDAARALASLQPALADDPGQPEAFGRAERLLQKSGDYAQLSKLYTRRIAASVDPDGKAELLRLHARLLHNKLGDAAGATAELGRLLTLRPGDLAALSERADLLCSQGRWSDAAEALATLVEETDDTEQRLEAGLLQAQVWLNQLHDPTRAREILARGLADDPDSVSIKQGLVQVAFAEGKWEEARQLLDEVAAEDQPHLQVWALTRLAEVAHVGLRDESMRAGYEREALLLAGANSPVLEQVIDRYREKGEQRRLVKVAADVLAETTRAEVASTMRLALARVMLEDMKQPAQALEWLRESLVRDPNDKMANLLFAQALEQQGEMEQAVARYRQLLERDPVLTPAYRGLSRLASLVGHPAVSASALAVLDAMGETSAKELEMLDALDPGATPGGRLDVVSIPADLSLDPLRRVFNLMLPHLGAVYPLRLGKVLRSTEPVALAAGRLATALGLSGVQVAVEGDVPAAAGVGEPVPLQVGAALARQPKSPAFRFWVGRALAFAALGGSLADQLPDDDLGELFEALFVQRPVDPGVSQLRKQLLRAMPRRARKVLEQLEAPRTDADYWTAYRIFARRRSDEVGVLICGDPRAALAELTGGDQTKLENRELRQLLQFIVSEEYGNYHRSLWSSTLTG